MKKLMLIAAVAFAAMVGQAACNISWNTGELKAPTSTGAFSDTDAKTAGYSVEVALTFYTDSSGAVGDAITGISGTSSSAWKNAGALVGITTSGYSFNQGTPYWVDGTITLTKGTETWKMDIDAFTFSPNKGTGNYGINFTNLSKLPAAWEAVPEPTSGILLVLGMAGLALKRKRA